MVDSWRNRSQGRDGAQGRASWRKKSSPTTQSRYWQSRSGSSLFSRWQVKLGVLGLLTIGLIGTLVSLVLRWDVKVPVVAMAVRGFDHPIPPNALAWEDLGRLQEILGTYDNVSLHVNNRVVGSPANLISTVREAIGQARAGGPAKDTLIVYLSSHGVVNERNEPCLLVDDSSANDPSTWLPMHTLLRSLIEAKPERSRLLLLLDSGKVDHVWPMGIVYNSFSERLADLIEQNRTAYPRLAVINSNSPGQVCQLAPEVGGSAFGFFVAVGLRGEAAGDDDVITLSELHQYLTSKVDQFAQDHRSSRQVPMILPSEPTEFPVSHPIAHATGQHIPTLKPRDLLQRQPAISELWHRYSVLLSANPQREHPVDWSLLRQKLLRVDSLLIAGKAYEDQLEWTISEVRSLLAQMEVNRDVVEHKDLSLASVRQSAGVTPDELVDARQAVEAWRKKASDTPETPPVPLLRLPVVATLVWEEAKRSAPTRAAIFDSLRLMPDSDPSGEPDYAEIQYLRLLLAGVDWRQVSPSVVARTLRVQDLAEKVANPTDKRSLYWIAPQLDESNKALRRASDELFVGTPEAIERAEQIWAGQTNYPTLLDVSQRVERAYALRDTAWSDGAYLAQWLSASPIAASNERLRVALAQLVSSTHELAQVLDDPPSQANDVQELRHLNAIAGTVENSLSTLQGALQQTYRELWQEKGNDQETLQQIGFILQVPLIPGDIRIRDDLWKRYFTHRFSATALTTQIEQPRSDRVVSDEDQLAWHTAFLTHPVLALLDRRSLDVSNAIPSVRRFPPAAQGDRSQREMRATQLIRLAELGGEVRARLNDLAASARILSDATTRDLSVESPPPARIVRKGLSRADRLVRAASPLLVERPWSQPEQDPVLQLRAFDEHQLLVWQGWRALRDFWATPDSVSRPYFATVVERLLITARQCYRPGQFYRDQLERALVAAESALPGWQPLAADSRSFTSEESYVRHAVRWQGNSQIPLGKAAVRIEKLSGQPVPLMDSRRRAPIGRRPVDVGESNELQHVILTQEGLSQSNPMEAIAFYRGHRRSTTFYLNAGSNAAVAKYIRPPNIRPRIRVRNDSKEKNNVIFILDCSRSMRYRHSYEGVEQSRLKIATGTLTTILKKLDPETYRIGMLIYGSRSAWRRDGNRVVLPPGQVHPAIDVDEVLALSPILEADPRTGRRIDVRGKLYQTLRRIIYRGDTPLYYSIIRGIRALQRANPDGPRHLVVITDGVDSTFGNREFPIPDAARTTAEDVKRALNATRIKLHIVGFSAPPDHPDDLTAWAKDETVWNQKRSEIRSLATGGFHDVLSPEQLQRALMESLQLKKFFARLPGAADPDPRDFVDVGRSWQMGASDPLGRYDVVLAESPEVNTVVDAQNGDWFELLYSPPRGRLEHRRFSRELQSDTTIGRFFVGVHLPTREVAKDISFFLSLQNAEATEFSRRPDAVWAEFQPIVSAATSSGSPSRTFVGYDVEFEPKNPVPVLRFRVAGWPDLADERAMARLWFAPSDTYRPSATRELELHRSSSFQLAGARISVEPRLGRVNESSRILIDEEHPRGSDGFPLHVRLLPPPDSAHHVFLPQSRRVRHIFVYEDRTPKTPTIEVTTHQQLKKTWIDSGPLSVELPNR